MGSVHWDRAIRVACVVSFGFAIGVANATDSADALTDGVVITATRTAAPVDTSLAPTSILTLKDIEQSQVLSFQDLMQGQPGIQFSNNGGLGKATSLFVRGTNSTHVLVLVDGIRIGSSTLGTTSFQYLPMDSIGRVEIVRGPLSSLYGSEAVGGVIQLFTRRAPSDGTTFEADASGGSHDTSSIAARLGGTYGRVSFGLSASNLSTDGYQNCTGAPYISPSSPGGGCYVFDPSNQGYHNVSGTARLRYEFSDTTDVEALVLRSQGGTRYAGSYTNQGNFAEQAASLAAHWTANDALRLTLQVGQSSDNERDSLNFVAPPGTVFDTTRQSASIQGDWKVAAGQLITFGSDYLKDQIASDNAFPVTSRNVTGVFGEYQAAVGAEDFALSVRQDHNSQYGDRTTGSAAWGHKLTPSLRFLASYGTGFHAPSFDDLYYPFFGNPTLKPETSHSADIGLEQRLTSLIWSAHAFDTRLNDLIAYDAALFAPENIEKAHIRGVELEGELKTGPWTLTAATSWLDAVNGTAGSTANGKILPRRARWTGRLGVAREWNAFRAALLLDTASRRFDDPANTLPLGGYVTADVQLEWTPLAAWTVQAKVANATDKRYEMALFYPQDRRNYLLTVRYRPAVLH